MKLKIKMLKNLISVLCAATILTSSVAPSVGAFKEAANAKADVVDRVKNANQALGVLKYKIKDMLQKTRRGSEKHRDTMNYYDKAKLFQVLSCLENSAHMVNEFEEIVINDLKLVENIERELVSALLGWEHSEFNIDNFDEYKNWLEKRSDSVSNMSAKLENIKSMIQEHKQQQAGEENAAKKLDGILANLDKKKALTNEKRAFTKWKEIVWDEAQKEIDRKNIKRVKEEAANRIKDVLETLNEWLPKNEGKSEADLIKWRLRELDKLNKKFEEGDVNIYTYIEKHGIIERNLRKDAIYYCGMSGNILDFLIPNRKKK